MNHGKVKMKNKLPRKRKKAFIKKLGQTNYIAMQVVNEILYEQEGKPCKFEKLELNKNNPRKIDFLGYW